MEKQHGYDKELAADAYSHDKEMAAINNGYEQEMAKLEYEYSLALSNNNYDRQLQIEKEMAALNQQYKIETLNRQAELLSAEYSLKNSSYAKQAAIDWDYAQKEAASKWDYTQKEADLASHYYNQQVAVDDFWENNDNNKFTLESYAHRQARIEIESLINLSADGAYSDLAAQTIRDRIKDGSITPLEGQQYLDRLP